MRKITENMFAKKIFDTYIDKYARFDYTDFNGERCLVQQFFEEQAKLPPSVQSNGAYISCPCKRCNPYTL